MKKEILKFSLLLTFVNLLGCASGDFSKKIESNDLDLLREESLMRYNSNRLDMMDGKEKDFISKALLACHQNKMVKGKGILEAEMHTNKTNPFYWNALGTCYFLSQSYAKAMFYYELGIEAAGMLKDNNKALAEGTINNNIGLLHLKYKRHNEAFEAFKISGKLLPEFITPQFNIAQLYIEFNENDKALAILKQLETKNPYDVDLLYSMALIYFRKNDLDNSLAALKKIKRDYLNRPDIVGLYAYNLMQKNHLAEARDIIERRLYAEEFDQRNKILLEEINQKIKEQAQTKKN